MTSPDVLRPVLDAFRTAPSPRGDGRTLHNWAVLARAAAEDLDVARLAEAHLDARDDPLRARRPRGPARLVLGCVGGGVVERQAASPSRTGTGGG